MARLAVIVALATALVAAGSAAGGSAGAGSPDGGRSMAKPIPPRNEIIAKRDAKARLGRLALPPDAVRSHGEPAGDGGALAFAFSGPPATPNAVTYHHWWVVRGKSPAAVIRYVRSHPPRGARIRLSASFAIRGTPTISGIDLSWRPVPGRLSMRWLLVELVQLTDGSTGVRADSEVVWIKPRPASERVPADTRRLVLTTARFGRRIQGPLTVKARDAIHRVVKLVNALPAAQPGATACPVDRGSRIRLAFYDRARTGARPLAVAVVDPSGCGLVTLTIRGHPEPPLAGGLALAKRVSRALRVTIDTGIAEPSTTGRAAGRSSTH